MVTLEESKPFRTLSAAELSGLRQIAQERAYSAGQTIFKEGDPGDGVYLVKDGLVEISARVTKESERVLAELGPGELFGEMAVIEVKPRSASARAARNSTVCFIPRAELLVMVERSPILAIELLREISQRLREFDRRYLEEILQAERLAVIGRFARSIVHDLKNPLGIIGLAADTAILPNSTPEGRRKAVATVRSQIDRINDLVGEILLFTQGSSAGSKLGLMDYSAFVQAVLNEIQPEIKQRGCVLESTPPPPGLKLLFDPKRVRRLFENLLHNATDAMPAGGTIRIRFRVEGTEVVTEIEDSGPGIAPEIADRLFEAFATFGKAYGTGLGLSICKRIVEDHHGRIWAANKPEGGAVLSFALPLPK